MSADDRPETREEIEKDLNDIIAEFKRLLKDYKKSEDKDNEPKH